MAAKPVPTNFPPRKARPPSTGRLPAKKMTAAQPAPTRAPFSPKNTVPAKMKNGPKKAK